MRLSRKATLLLMVIAAGSMIGCTQGELAGLPIHELDLGSRSPVAGPRRAAGVPVEQPVRGAREWHYIVIHHSATAGGNADVFDRLHRSPRFGFDELGYHFVITNGDGGTDGQVEVGPRWVKQKWGAHTGGTPGNEYNNCGIGVCLVGDFSTHMPTEAQLASLRRLVLQLSAAYSIPPQNIIAHRDAPNASTQCPGDTLHSYLATFRDDVGRYVVAARTPSPMK